MESRESYNLRHKAIVDSGPQKWSSEAIEGMQLALCDLVMDMILKCSLGGYLADIVCIYYKQYFSEHRNNDPIIYFKKIIFFYIKITPPIGNPFELGSFFSDEASFRTSVYGWYGKLIEVVDHY